MQCFKKAILAAIAFLLCVFLLSVLLYEPFAHSEVYSYCDAKLRKSLTGQIEFLVIGSSPGLRAFDTRIYDDTLNTCCYNASGAYMPWTGRLALLKEEIDRQPLKSVVIEISYDSFMFDVHSSTLVEGHMYVQPRIGSFSDRLSYFFKNVSLDTFEKFYTNNMHYGISYYFTLLKKGLNGTLSSPCCNVDYSLKGYSPYEDNIFSNCSLNREEAIIAKNSRSISLNFRKDNLESLKTMIRLCRDKRIDVFLVVTPCTDSSVWSFDNGDDFDARLKEIAEENGCVFWDFNLMIDRFELFSDECDWWDGMHMSREGSKAFSEASSDIFKAYYEGENVERYFFNNYEEMKEASPYNQYLG